MTLKTFNISTFTAFALLVIAANSFQGCKSKKVKTEPLVAKNDTVTTASGLRYIITTKNPSGAIAEKGNRIEAHYTGTLTDGKKFDSSRDRDKTFSFVLGEGRVIKGWDEGFTYLREGERATFIIPPSIGYGNRDRGSIPANSTMIFDVELIKVIKPEPYTAYSGEGKDTIKLPSGLKYIVIDQGDPTKKASAGQTAKLFYAGYLLNGFKFDGNFGGFETFDLPVVGGGVIQGWLDILPLMNKSMKLRVIIPPNLAYGENEIPNLIPANSTLIFDMYLADLL